MIEKRDSTHPSRTILIITISLVLFMSIVWLGWQWFDGDQPANEMQLQYISAVSVVRDTLDERHFLIHGENRQDILYASGYMQAAMDLFRISVKRLMAEGRMTPFFGPQWIKSDNFFQQFSLYSTARSMAEKLGGADLSDLQAFADGLNAYQSSANRSLPFKIWPLPRETWTPADLIAVFSLEAELKGNTWKRQLVLEELERYFGHRAVSEILNDSCSAPILSDQIPDEYMSLLQLFDAMQTRQSDAAKGRFGHFLNFAPEAWKISVSAPGVRYEYQSSSTLSLPLFTRVRSDQMQLSMPECGQNELLFRARKVSANGLMTPSGSKWVPVTLTRGQNDSLFRSIGPNLIFNDFSERHRYLTTVMTIFFNPAQADNDFLQLLSIDRSHDFRSAVKSAAALKLSRSHFDLTHMADLDTVSLCLGTKNSQKLHLFEAGDAAGISECPEHQPDSKSTESIARDLGQSFLRRLQFLNDRDSCLTPEETRMLQRCLTPDSPDAYRFSNALSASFLFRLSYFTFNDECNMVSTYVTTEFFSDSTLQISALTALADHPDSKWWDNRRSDTARETLDTNIRDAYKSLIASYRNQCGTIWQEWEFITPQL